jgi:hypothetical protein
MTPRLEVLGLQRLDALLLLSLLLFGYWTSGPVAVLVADALILHWLRGCMRWQLFAVYVCAALVCWGLAVDLVAPQNHRNWPDGERSFNTRLLAWGVMRPRTCPPGGVAARQCALCAWLPTTPHAAPPPPTHTQKKYHRGGAGSCAFLCKARSLWLLCVGRLGAALHGVHATCAISRAVSPLPGSPCAGRCAVTPAALLCRRAPYSKPAPG